MFEVYLRRRMTVRNLKRYPIASVCNASRDYWRARKNIEPLPDDVEKYGADSVDISVEAGCLAADWWRSCCGSGSS